VAGIRLVLDEWSHLSLPRGDGLSCDPENQLRLGAGSTATLMATDLT
jgi:hypothetical protein